MICDDRRTPLFTLALLAAFAAVDQFGQVQADEPVKEQATFKGHVDPVTSLAYSPDSKTLASGSEDKTIRLWDVATGKQLATLKGHVDSVRSVAYGPDGRTLASESWDTTINFWDVGPNNCLVGSAEDPRTPVTELEDTWQEPTMPGESTGVRCKITFAGDKVTLTIGGQVFTGTFLAPLRAKETSRHSTIYFLLKDSEDKATYLSGLYRVEKDELSLRLDPEVSLPVEPLPEDSEEQLLRKFAERRVASRGPYLGRAPRALILGKVRD